jgi:hypothetical protein
MKREYAFWLMMVLGSCVLVALSVELSRHRFDGAHIAVIGPDRLRGIWHKSMVEI